MPRAVILFIAVFAGCASTPLPQPSASASGTTRGPSATGETTAALAPNECRERIENVNLDDEATINEVSRCLFTRAGAEASRTVLDGRPDRDAAWAAVWIYSSSGNDPAPLRPLVAAPDPSIRVMAAAGLVAFGDAAGFPILREALADQQNLLGSHPPMAIRHFSISTLTRFVVADGVPAWPDASAGVPVVIKGWDGWLAENASFLTFSTSAGTWGPQ